MTTDPAEKLPTSPAVSGQANPNVGESPTSDDSDFAWLEFPLGLVTCLFLPRLWLSDPTAFMHGGTWEMKPGNWSGFFLVVNVVLGFAQLSMLCARIAKGRSI